MSLAIVNQLLKDAIGLDVMSIGESAIVRAVRERQLACHMTATDAYIEHVQQSSTELQALVEAVVVAETWFFRNGEAFAALAREVAGEWLRAHADGMFRLLSVPCATGEEPYSMAMALLDGGFPSSRFRVDAVDISERGLGHGRRGIYGRSSFRGADTTFRDRFFAPLAQSHQLADGVRQLVTFRQANLLAPAFVADSGIYDVIFCRNLLIYFDGATQERAIATLLKLLAPRGVLFVGASETGVLLSQGLESAKLPMAFAFRKAVAARRDVTRDVTRAGTRDVIRASHSIASHFAGKPVPKHVSLSLPRTAPVDPPVVRRNGMAVAQELADQGRFAEAATACEAHLRTEGSSAPVFYLLALVRDANGNHADAEAAYRKTLYLDPHHRDALAHLALLMDTKGRQADAVVLRNRIRRLELTRKD